MNLPRRMIHKLPRVYPITDLAISGLSHAEQVERLAHGGATLIQLREKLQPAHDFYLAAKTALEIARKHNVRLIINDRVDVAMALGADGVHLGQDDLPADRARSLMGDEAMIGYSTHSVDQARHALTQPIDYLAIGPIFATSTKTQPEPVVGVEGLRAVRRAVGDFPLVAIGGITLENAADVFAAGADSVAIISGLLSDPAAISSRTSLLLKLATHE